MKKTLALVVLALVTAAALPAPSTAFHGASWKGQGTATLVATGATLPLVATWGGQGLGVGGTLKLEIGNPPIVHNVAVNEDVSNVWIEGCAEFVDPYHMTSTIDPNLVFRIDGVMDNDLCSACFCETNSHYFGHLYTLFDVAIHVVGDKDTLADG